MMWGPYAGQLPGWMGWWAFIPPLLLVTSALALLIWALARAARPRMEPPRPVMTGHEPEEILRRRYASGEIDARTFEEMRARLAAPTAPTAPIAPTARVEAREQPESVGNVPTRP